jgi:hypothetical protein
MRRVRDSSSRRALLRTSRSSSHSEPLLRRISALADNDLGPDSRILPARDASSHATLLSMTARVLLVQISRLSRQSEPLLRRISALAGNEGWPGCRNCASQRCPEMAGMWPLCPSQRSSAWQSESPPLERPLARHAGLRMTIGEPHSSRSLLLSSSISRARAASAAAGRGALMSFAAGARPPQARATASRIMR